jgi:hypothetical protein
MLINHSIFLFSNFLVSDQSKLMNEEHFGNYSSFLIGSWMMFGCFRLLAVQKLKVFLNLIFRWIDPILLRKVSILCDFFWNYSLFFKPNLLCLIHEVMWEYFWFPRAFIDGMFGLSTCFSQDIFFSRYKLVISFYIG